MGINLDKKAEAIIFSTLKISDYSEVIVKEYKSSSHFSRAKYSEEIGKRNNEINNELKKYFS